MRAYSTENWALRAQATLARNKIEAQAAHAAAGATSETYTSVHRWYIRNGALWASYDVYLSFRRAAVDRELERIRHGC